jgi:hypothetical protein
VLVAMGTVPFSKVWAACVGYPMKSHFGAVMWTGQAVQLVAGMAANSCTRAPARSGKNAAHGPRYTTKP